MCVSCMTLSQPSLGGCDVAQAAQLAALLQAEAKGLLLRLLRGAGASEEAAAAASGKLRFSFSAVRAVLTARVRVPSAAPSSAR